MLQILCEKNMKTKLLATLVAACCATPALAQETSSLTIYGLADAGLHIANNGGSDRKVKVVSGITEGSRLGFKGTEDLGGGYKSMFILEARLEMDTGKNSVGNVSNNTSDALIRGMERLPPTILAGLRKATNPETTVNTTNALFDRTALVGLITPVGAVLLGRQYTPVYEVFAFADAFEVGTGGSWGWVNGGLGGLLTTGSAIRSDKAIQYRIKTPEGFGGAIMYGFDKSGYVGLDKKFWAFNVTYRANGWDVGIAHNKGYNQTGQVGLVTSIIGGSYSTGDLKVFAGYQKMKNENSVLIPVLVGQWDTGIAPGLTTQVGAPTAAALRNIYVTNLNRNFYLDSASFHLGMHYKIGNGRLMAGISHQDDKTVLDSGATLYSVGYDYYLSKRTDIFAVLSYMKNKNQGQYAPGIAAAAGGFTATPGMDAKALQIGIRHKF